MQDSQVLSDQPAYVSWASDNEEDISKAFSIYGQALEESSHSVANVQRDFRGLTTYAGGRPGFVQPILIGLGRGKQHPSSQKILLLLLDMPTEE